MSIIGFLDSIFDFYKKTNTLKLPVSRCTDDSIMEKCIARDPPVPTMMMRKILMIKIGNHENRDEKDNGESPPCQPAVN